MFIAQLQNPIFYLFYVNGSKWFHTGYWLALKEAKTPFAGPVALFTLIKVVNEQYFLPNLWKIIIERGYFNMYKLLASPTF